MGGPRSAVWLVLVVAAGAAAAPIPAVPKPADDEMTLPAAKLLRHRKVQKELRLSADQRVAIIDGLADLDEEHGKKLVALLKQPDPPEEALDKLEQEKTAAAEKFFKHTAMKELTPAQRARLRQIDWQVRGPAAFADPRVEHALRLTDGQKKTVADLVDQLQDKTDRYVDKLGNDDSDNLKEDLLQFRAEAMKKLETALTAKQRDTWKVILGEPAKGLDPTELWLTSTEEADTLAP
ncbi:MAG: hypothetical protein JWO38_3942 [Gemmataceae bacterium]|nr:hypothetical protein [Gemmataceae bacterium]